MNYSGRNFSRFFHRFGSLCIAQVLWKICLLVVTLFSCSVAAYWKMSPWFGGTYNTVPNLLINQIELNISLYSLYYARACNEFAGPIFASLHPAISGNKAPFEEVLQRWQAVGNLMSDWTGPRFEPSTSRSRDERAQPTGQFLILN